MDELPVYEMDGPLRIVFLDEERKPFGAVIWSSPSMIFYKHRGEGVIAQYACLNDAQGHQLSETLLPRMTLTDGDTMEIKMPLTVAIDGKIFRFPSRST